MSDSLSTSLPTHGFPASPARDHGPVATSTRAPGNDWASEAIAGVAISASPRQHALTTTSRLGRQTAGSGRRKGEPGVRAAPRGGPCRPENRSDEAPRPPRRPPARLAKPSRPRFPASGSEWQESASARSSAHRRLVRDRERDLALGDELSVDRRPRVHLP